MWEVMLREATCKEKPFSLWWLQTAHRLPGKTSKGAVANVVAGWNA